MEEFVAIKKLDAFEYEDILARANRREHLAERQSHQLVQRIVLRRSPYETGDTTHQQLREP
jgi:hypothetical protein